jgi:hypoxanthine phosphoribosyltransferase
VTRLIPDVKDYKPDILVALADGAVPAAIIVLNCRIPYLYFIDAPTGSRSSKKEGNIETSSLPSTFNNKRVLIVDNHIYTGTNMRMAVNEIQSRGAKEIKTLALFKHSVATAVFSPDYHAYTVHGHVRSIPWSITDDHKKAYLS